MVRVNPFRSIYDICNSGTAQSKINNLPMFPRIIDIEISNHCNFHCLMCYTGNMASRRKRGFMPEDIYLKFLDQISPHHTPIRFIGWGEPTLHPQWLHYFEEAKKRNLLVHFNTNGSTLTQEIVEKLLQLNIDSIKFSFQGVDRVSYKEMRNIDFFDKLIKNVSMIHKARGEQVNPFIHVSTTTTYESNDTISDFNSRLSSITDLVTVGRTVLDHVDLNRVKLCEDAKNRLAYLKTCQSVNKVHPDCPEIFDKLSINWDGKISACCGDYDDLMVVGNIISDPLSDIWSNPLMNNYRRILANNDHDKLTLCRNCWAYI